MKNKIRLIDCIKKQKLKPDYTCDDNKCKKRHAFSNKCLLHEEVFKEEIEKYKKRNS